MYEETGILPSALSSKPSIEFWMVSYLKAFWDLCGRRSYGMGPNPISFQDLVLYFNQFEFDDFEEFFQVVTQMDEKWLAIMAARKSK